MWFILHIIYALLIGGGLPVGSLLLIEEDYSGNYAKLLLKYFLGKGHIYKSYIYSTCRGLLELRDTIVNLNQSIKIKSLLIYFVL